MELIQIVLVDDHSIVRDGIKALLEEEPDIQVVGEAPNGRLAIELVKEKTPDILIVDIRMPEMNGIDTIVELKKLEIETKSIILSMHDSEEYIMQSVRAGAVGYLLKDTSKHEFIKAIRTVRDGGKYFSGEVSDVLVDQLLNPSPAIASKSFTDHKPPFGLTNRELEILKMVLSGMTNKEISEELEISQRTIETHRYNFMKKMKVKNLMELSMIAREYLLV